MRRITSICRFLGITLLAFFALGLVGCATSDQSENMSARPWNSPKGWENGGLPSMLNEGR